MNFKFNDYVIFPIIDSGDTVGYVSRHIWSKTEIDEHNRKARNNGTYQIMRYRNSTENDFVKLLYNYDAVIADETDTVILVEGIFDAISLTRKLNLYKNHSIAAVATFGRKISDIQIYKLQTKGVQTIVIGYDGDSVEPIKKISEQLDEYFDVYVADITDPTQDFDDMEFWDIYDAFTSGLKTSVEYKLNKIQL
jgi:DNA primase